MPSLTIIPTHRSPDYAAPTMYWSFIETSLGTVCACLPMFRPLFARQSMGGFVDRVQGFLSLCFTKGIKLSSSTDGRTPNQFSLGSNMKGNFDTNVGANFYDTHGTCDVHVGSQPLAGTSTSRTGLSQKGIMVSSEILQSDSRRG